MKKSTRILLSFIGLNIIILAGYMLFKDYQRQSNLVKMKEELKTEMDQVHAQNRKTIDSLNAVINPPDDTLLVIQKRGRR